MLNSLTPVFASTGRYLAPIMRGAMRDAIKHTTEFAILAAGGTVVAVTGTGIYAGCRKIKHKWQDLRLEHKIKNDQDAFDRKMKEALDLLNKRDKAPSSPVTNWTDKDPSPAPAE